MFTNKKPRHRQRRCGRVNKGIIACASFSEYGIYAAGWWTLLILFGQRFPLAAMYGAEKVYTSVYYAICFVYTLQLWFQYNNTFF